MKSFLHRAYLNPFARVAALILALGLAVTFWDNLSGMDWGADKAPTTALPQPLAAHLSISTGENAVAGCSDDGKLYVVALSGEAGTPGTPRNIPLPGGGICGPIVWSPDGSRLLMPYRTTTADQASPGLLLVTIKGRPSARILRLRGGLDPAIPPAWSPDGFQIAYVAGIRTKALGGLWLVDLKTRLVTRLRLGRLYSPAFSPSGDRVLFEEDTAMPPNAAFSEEMGDWPHIWSVGSVGVRGGAVKRLAEWTQGSLMPINTVLLATRPEGVRYSRYFHSEKKGSKLEVWDASESGAHSKKMTIALDYGHLSRDLEWTGDGRRFAYLDYISAGGPSSIRLADVDEGKVQTIAPGRGAPNTAPPAGQVVGRAWSDPALSSRGRWIVASLASVVTGPPPGQAADDEDSGDHPVHVSVETQKVVLMRVS